MGARARHASSAMGRKKAPAAEVASLDSTRRAQIRAATGIGCTALAPSLRRCMETRLPRPAKAAVPLRRARRAYSARSSSVGANASHDSFRRGPIVSPTRRLVIASSSERPPVDWDGEESAPTGSSGPAWVRSERTRTGGTGTRGTGTPQNPHSRGYRALQHPSTERHAGEKERAEAGVLAA